LGAAILASAANVITDLPPYRAFALTIKLPEASETISDHSPGYTWRAADVRSFDIVAAEANAVIALRMMKLVRGGWEKSEAAFGPEPKPRALANTTSTEVALQASTPWFERQIVWKSHSLMWKILRKARRPAGLKVPLASVMCAPPTPNGLGLMQIWVR
jgi:hypothetical protein